MEQPARQSATALTLIDMGVQLMQVEALESLGLRAKVEELLQQKEALVKENENLMRDKKSLTKENEGLKQNQSDAEQRIVKLERESREYKQKADRLESKVKRLRDASCELPALLAEALTPLKFETMSTPKVIEVEARKPSPSTPHYDLLEKYDFSTATSKKTVRKPSLVVQSATRFSLRVTCRGYNAESKGGRTNNGVVDARKMEL